MSHVTKKKSNNAARNLLSPPLKKNYLLHSIEKLDQERKVQVLRDLVKTSPSTKVHVPLGPTHTMVIVLLFVSTTTTQKWWSTLSIVVRQQTSRDSWTYLHFLTS